MRRVGILGGTFNPVHIGHMLAAQAVRERCGLDVVRLMPCHTPPHKTCAGLAPAADRLAMLRLAAAGDPGLEVGTDEIERGGVSFAVDTVRDLLARRPDETPHFIVGLDMLRELHLWRCAADLLGLCPFIVVARPGGDAPLRPSDLALPPPWPERLLAGVVRGRLCEVSSREIRARIAAGRPIRYLVPVDVERYVMDRGLYREAAGLPGAGGMRD